MLRFTIHGDPISFYVGHNRVALPGGGTLWCTGWAAACRVNAIACTHCLSTARWGPAFRRFPRPRQGRNDAHPDRVNAALQQHAALHTHSSAPRPVGVPPSGGRLGLGGTERRATRPRKRGTPTARRTPHALIRAAARWGPAFRRSPRPRRDGTPRNPTA